MRKFKQVISFRKEIPPLLFKKISAMGAISISLCNSEPQVIGDNSTAHGILIEKKIAKWLLIVWREPVTIDNIIKVEKFLSIMTEF